MSTTGECFWDDDADADADADADVTYDLHQLQVIEQNHDADCAVFAGPGSGKTTTCIGVVRYAVARLRWDPTTSLLVIMFSREAAENFKKKAARSGLTSFAHRSVMTLHSLAGYIMSRLGHGGNTGGMETVIANAVLRLHHLTALEFAHVVPRLARTRLILVDEAQDISRVQYELIRLLRDRIPGCVIYLVGDPNQNIFQFQGGSDVFLRNHAVRNRKHLPFNYRSTAELVTFINEHRPWRGAAEFPAMIAVRGAGGVKPEWYTHASRERAIDVITAQFVAYGVESTALLGPFKTNSTKPGVNETCIGLNSILDRLRQQGVRVEPNYVFGDDIHRTSAVHTGTNNLYTIHGSKGLEFKNVILVDFQENTFKRLPSAEELHEARYLWFVALSRAKDRLSAHSIVGPVRKPDGRWSPVIPWVGMQHCAPDTYDHRSESPHPYVWPRRPKNNSTPVKLVMVSITEILKALQNRRTFNETKLLHFQSLTRFHASPGEPVWRSSREDGEGEGEAARFPSYSTLFGDFAHFVVEATYARRHGTAGVPSFVPSFVRHLQQEAEKTVIVPATHAAAYGDLKRMLGNVLARRMVTCSDLVALRDQNQTPRVCALIAHVTEHLRPDDVVYLREEYATSWFDRDEIRRRCATWFTDDTTLFFIATYRFQLSNNLPFLMVPDDDTYRTLLHYVMPFADDIKRWVSSSDEFSAGWRFELPRHNDALHLAGILDAISPTGEIVEFKFSTADFTFFHKLQGVLQYVLEHGTAEFAPAPAPAIPSARSRVRPPAVPLTDCAFRLINIRTGVSSRVTCEFPDGDALFYDQIIQLIRAI